MCNYENSTFLQAPGSVLSGCTRQQAVLKSRCPKKRGRLYCFVIRGRFQSWLGVLPDATDCDAASNSTQPKLELLQDHGFDEVNVVYRETVVWLLTAPPLYTLVRDHHSESLKDSATPWRVCSKVDGALSTVTWPNIATPKSMLHAPVRSFILKLISMTDTGIKACIHPGHQNKCMTRS